MATSVQGWLASRYLGRLRAPRDLLRAGARRYADRTALVSSRGTLTYAQLARRVWQLADALADLGVRRGDRIASIATGGQDQIEIMLASYELGTVLVGFTTTHPLDVIESALVEAPPKVLFYDPATRSDVVEVAGRLGAVPVAGLAELERLIAGGQPRLNEEPLDPDDLAGLGFTSGTTGQPKALTTTQGIWLTSLRLSVQNVRVTLGGRDVALPGMPISGAGGGLVLPSLAGGAALVLPDDFETTTLLDAIEEHQVSRAFLTPSTLIDLLDRPDLDSRDLSSLTSIIYGTAPTPAPKIAEAVRRFGPILQQGYGMAEVLPPVSLLQPEDHWSRNEPASLDVLRSVGRPVPQVTVRVVDANGTPVPDGERGEIEVMSPTVFAGYWGRPDLTAAAFRDGYLRTRDHGYLDRDGRLVVLDRDVDIIDRPGHRVYPREVEEAAHTHPSVKEACLVADGDTMVLAVSWRAAWRDRPDYELRAMLQRHLNHDLRTWQMPDRIDVLAELPRSQLNKVLRREVRAQLTGAS